MYVKGFKSMLPIMIGVFPFGLVMGSVSFSEKLTLAQTVGMNVLVFAGSAQLAVIELMIQDSTDFIILLTGLIINLRFMLYSAAFAPYLKAESFLIKFFCSYTLTDQTYSAMKTSEDLFKNNIEAIQFYIGSAVCMVISWQGAVVVGYVAGNFIPNDVSLDFAIPLSFVALVMPTIKNKKYFYVALLSSLLSVLFKDMPLNLGLLLSIFFSLLFAVFLTSPYLKSYSTFYLLNILNNRKK